MLLLQFLLKLAKALDREASGVGRSADGALGLIKLTLALKDAGSPALTTTKQVHPLICSSIRSLFFLPSLACPFSTSFVPCNLSLQVFPFLLVVHSLSLSYESERHVL